MVWLHGGGFASGNGCYTMYDGANLARKRDVVTVTINHRLNALQDKISAAWTNFARTGNPSHKGLPNWPAFDTTKRATMLLNNDSRVANDPNGEERRLVASLRRA